MIGVLKKKYFKGKKKKRGLTIQFWWYIFAKHTNHMEVRPRGYNNHVVKRSQKVVEAIYHHLKGEMNFLTFQETLGKELNQLGEGILIDVLETKGQHVSEHKEERKGWEVVRRDKSSP